MTAKRQALIQLVDRMDKSELAATLVEFNEWRRGDESVEMPDVVFLGVVIDKVINILKNEA